MSDSRSIIYDFSKLSAKEVEQHREIARQHGDNRTPYFAGETITLQDDDSARQAAETDNSNLRFGQFSAGHYHSLYLSPTGKVYGCGSNGSGSSHDSNTSIISPPQAFNYFSKTPIGQIAAGESCSFFVTLAGDRVYMTHKAYRETPRLLTGLRPGEKIRQVSVCAERAIFITTDGKIYHNSDNREAALQEIILPANTKITQIAASSYLTLFLSDQGEVYSMQNSTYERGIFGPYFEYEKLKLLKQFPADTKIVKIAAGVGHCIYLSSNNEVYLSGSNAYHQCGAENKNLNFAVPTLLATQTRDTKIIDIAAGGFHSLFLGENGKVYGCGLNTHGQISRDIRSEHVTTPTCVPGLPENEKVCRMAAGGWHSLYLTESNHLYGCGSNNENRFAYIDATCVGEDIRPLQALLFWNAIIRDEDMQPSRKIRMSFTVFKDVKEVDEINLNEKGQIISRIATITK